MELVIKPYRELPCRLDIFSINGKDADQEDFGEVYDHCNELDYKLGIGCCGWCV